jgi:protein-disulfide isomerase
MREGGFRNVGGLAQRLASQMAKGRGASIARLRADWPAIVGPDLARATRPEALVMGRGKAGGKLLRLRVSGAAALEVQHMSSQIVERVNAYAGIRLIDDLRLSQGTIASAAPPPAPLPRPSAEVTARLAGKVAQVKDPELRQALARLGSRIAMGRRSAIVGVVGSLLLARGVRAQENLLVPLNGDHILGKPDAPNILIDYFSLTCPHCANFNAAVLPRLKQEAIATGKAALVMRHFPSESVATHAAQIAEGVGPAKFFEAVDALFRSQVDWLTSPTPEVEMVKGLDSVGLTPEQATAYFGDDQLLDKIIADVQTGQSLQVRGTPTLFINGQFFGSPPGGAEGADVILRQLGR